MKKYFKLIVLPSFVLAMMTGLISFAVDPSSSPIATSIYAFIVFVGLMSLEEAMKALRRVWGSTPPPE